MILSVEKSWEEVIWLLKHGHLVKINLSGYSMFPYLNPGNKVIIKQVNFDEIKVGDIIAFKSNNLSVLHRVIKKNNNHIFCKGDFMLLPDNKISQEDIIGKLEKIEKNGKLINPYSISHRYYAKLIVMFPKLFIFMARFLFYFRTSSKT